MSSRSSLFSYHTLSVGPEMKSRSRKTDREGGNGNLSPITTPTYKMFAQ